MNHLCYISIGSNLGDRVLNCNIAIDELSNFSNILNISSFYETEPWGYQDNNYYINLVVKLETSYSPKKLLFKLQRIENKIGRKQKKTKHLYESRVIDLDILFFDKVVINELDLVIPHPKLYNRNYVLEPFCEIDAHFFCPLKNKKMIDLLKDCIDSHKISLYPH